MAFPLRRVALATLAVGLGVAAPGAADAQLRGGFRSSLAPRGDDTVTPFANFGFTANIRGNDVSAGSACMNGFVALGFVAADPTGCQFSFSNLGNLIDQYGIVASVLPRDMNSTPVASGQLGWGAGTVDGAQAFGFTWDGVFSFGTTNPNFAQLLFINRGAGDFDLEFNYGAIAAGTIPFAGVGDDGSLSGARYEALITPGANSRITQCWRSGTVGDCGATTVIPERVCPFCGRCSTSSMKAAAIASARVNPFGR